MTAKPAYTAPKHLRAATRAWVESVCRDYALEPHHLRLLQLAGEAWDRSQQAREVLAREGITFRDRFRAIRPHPAVAIERDARTGFARLLRELQLDVEAPPDDRPARLPGGRKVVT